MKYASKKDRKRAKWLKQSIKDIKAQIDKIEERKADLLIGGTSPYSLIGQNMQIANLRRRLDVAKDELKRVKARRVPKEKK